jgi:hypothetical protein
MGDVFLGGDLLNRSCENLVDSSVFNNADVRVVNLEQPISDSQHVEDKCTLHTGSSALKKLKELKINAVNLAHNHIQDKGLDAVAETIDHLDSVNIKHFGAGVNIKSAAQSYWITNDIAMLGYCEFGKSYLSQIAVAQKNQPGVNPLRLEKIKSDLDMLPAGKKAILYFHWGMEHVWLPPAEDIDLAKLLLEDDRVITIIGMHSHRVQGVVNHAGKQAYMCLGNFIFPNFYITPPVQISYPSEEIKTKTKFITRQYHKVYEVTYKKWRLVNRVSLILEFCTKTEKINPVFVVQDDNTTAVKELKGIKLSLFEGWFNILIAIYKLPKSLYKILWKIHVFEAKSVWRLQIMWFHLKQLGLKKFLKKAMHYARK